MTLDEIKFRLGGDWYDTWWCAIFGWFTFLEENDSEWLMEEWRKDFFNDINAGWLEMYPPKPESREERLQRLIQSFTIS